LAEKDIPKKEAELEKKRQDDVHEIDQVFRKPGQSLYLVGKNYLKSDDMKVRCVYEAEGSNQIMAFPCEAVYKNKCKIGIIVPEIEGPQPGVIDITMQMSFNNGQQFTGNKKIKYLCFDPEMTPEHRVKLEDEEMKKCKASKGKK